MFHPISWSQYLTTVAYLLIVYYIVVAYLFYKLEILSLLGVSVVEPGQMPAATVEELRRAFTHNDNMHPPFPATDADLTPVIQALQDETAAYLQGASVNRPAKEEVLFALQTITDKYSVLKTADCRTDVLYELFQLANSLFPSMFSPADFGRLLK